MEDYDRMTWSDEFVANMFEGIPVEEKNGVMFPMVTLQQACTSLSTDNFDVEYSVRDCHLVCIINVRRYGRTHYYPVRSSLFDPG